MKAVDRVFSCLLIVASLVHALGSFRAYDSMPEILLWSLSPTVAGLLLAGINLLRAGRPYDYNLAWLSFAGCLAWISIAIAFGPLIGNLLDFRVLIQGAIALVLAMTSLRTATYVPADSEHHH